MEFNASLQVSFDVYPADSNRRFSSAFRSRVALELENFVLRHQLNV
jgi:hypothetical protein